MWQYGYTRPFNINNINSHIISHYLRLSLELFLTTLLGQFYACNSFFCNIGANYPVRLGWMELPLLPHTR